MMTDLTWPNHSHSVLTPSTRRYFGTEIHREVFYLCCVVCCVCVCVGIIIATCIKYEFCIKIYIKCKTSTSCKINYRFLAFHIL